MTGISRRRRILGWTRAELAAKAALTVREVELVEKYKIADITAQQKILAVLDGYERRALKRALGMLKAAGGQ